MDLNLGIQHPVAFTNNKSYFKDNPEPGDCVLFKWKDSDNSSVDHIGIVIAYDGEKIITVEGNALSEGADCDGVCSRVYSIKSSEIDGFCRPLYGSILEWKDMKVQFKI